MRGVHLVEHQVRAVDPEELLGVELGLDSRRGLVKDVDLLAHVQAHVVARGLDPVDVDLDAVLEARVAQRRQDARRGVGDRPVEIEQDDHLIAVISAL